MSIAVKMNTLLVLPVVAVILLQAVGKGKAMRQASIMAQVQVRPQISAQSAQTYDTSDTPCHAVRDDVSPELCL